LVELSVVVVLVAILAAIGAMSYRRWISTSRMSEATHVSANIRQSQEAYKAETGTYANVSSTITDYYPAANPGAFVTAWGGACGNCTAADAWTQIPVKPDGPVMYGYSTVAGVGGTVASAKSSKMASAMMASSASSLASATASVGATDPFYLVQAYGDTNGDGIACTVEGYSFSNDLVVTNEGE
jgi:Tfp pilus assembly protein PilE